MQTRLAPRYQGNPIAQEAEAILRSCVHCGFCNATCPTYQVLGDELDGPRGRIYLLKELLAGEEARETTRLHLDRCLSCRACETTCPSGVRYGRLLELGRHLQNSALPRSPDAVLKRRLIRAIISQLQRLRPLLGVAQALRPILRDPVARTLPAPTPVPRPIPVTSPRRGKVLALAGCVQSVATPRTEAALQAILAKLGYTLLHGTGAGCCGALSLHLDAWEEAHAQIRRNIDAWWPAIEAGVDTILISASGCGSVVKDYGEILRNDSHYAAKAARVAALARDPSEWLYAHRDELSQATAEQARIAFHSPCSLQHGQRIQGLAEAILQRLGYRLLPVADSHLCCGSAGSYSLLQPQLAQELRRRKLKNLEAEKPQWIATANVGCQLFLAQATQTPLRHWLELVAELL
ncbi:glycolate oxidase subunit GlcF [Acidithiobacillus sp. AMEEHan]|uniref:glycolate oxidase subunit GlcF n=1 Tax=Acidithiobacillus sp. AMEEHan TaxID=2994951 RepID=UPI0027E3FB53|nr:glycolate oxidase subunit GlcF [Acidithiobacillus sp. AMEEHan]